MKRALFVHNGTPGRFQFIAKALLERGWSGVLLNDHQGNDLPGMASLRWRIQGPRPAPAYAVLASVDAAILRGRAAADAAEQLKARGFQPDVIIGHPAWGEMLFLGEVFGGVPQIQVGELYYRTRDSDLDFDPEFATLSLERRARVVAKNHCLATSHADASRIVCPTRYQASTFPKPFHSLIRVIHEGVDTVETQRRQGVSLQLASGVVLDGSTPVVTFVNRHFEPMRGFHSFMRALPHLLREVPDVHVVMVGADARQGYGPLPAGERTWKQVMLEEVGRDLDPARVHFVGHLPREKLLDVLSISTAHVYLTYPFVLSWSLLDAMACECLVVASDTAPVREVVRHGENGLLVDFFDPPGLARTLAEICADPGRHAALRQAARATVVAEYDRDRHCLPEWLNLIEEVLSEPAGRAAFQANMT